MKCKICGNDVDNKIFKIKDFQYGLDEEFDYFECSNCGCLQIKEIPSNIGKYYPDNYGPHNSQVNGIKKFLESEIEKFYFSNKSILGKLLSYYPTVDTVIFGEVWYEYVEKNIANKNIPILDIGCGSGQFLQLLQKIGYNNLKGIDLFIDEERIPKGLDIVKVGLDEYEADEKFDIITLNHSFEHMDNQVENLSHIKNLLSDKGLIFLRIPVKSEYIWKEYGINWFQIDAPRHFILHTIKSFEILADKVGLKIKDIVFDSTHSQFTSSNRYKKGITLFDDSLSFEEVNENSLKYYKDKTKELNEKRQGDQAIFILSK